MRDGTPAGQIGQTPETSLRSYLVLVTFIGSLGPIGWGLTHSAIVTDLPWNDTMVRQAGLLGIVAGGAALLSAVAEWHWRLRIEIGLALVGAIALVAAFGAVPAAVVAIFLISATVIGTALWRSISIGSDPPLVLLTVFGAATYSIAFTLLGPIPINTLPLHAGLLGAPLLIACAIPYARRELFARLARLREALAPPAERSLAEVVALTVFFFVALLHALLAALPERYWDAMVLHLYIPSYVAGNLAWSYDASLFVGAFMPAAVDWIYTHFFLLSGELGARLYNFTAFMLLCTVSYVLASRIVTRHIGIWLVVLFASTPLAFLESSTLFIEHTLALWIVAAAGIVLVSDLRPDLRHLVCTLTLLAGASMSKLQGALAAAVIGTAALGLYIRQRPPAADLARALVACLALGAVACFPYAFSWIKTGNPFLPLYNDIFKSEFYPSVAFRDTRWVGRFDWALLYDATFFSGRYLEAAPGALGLSAILLVPLALIGPIVRSSPAALMCIAFATAIFLPIASQTQYLRYFYPLIPMLLAPAGLAIAVLTRRPIARAAVYVLFTAVAAFNVYKIASAGWLMNHFDFRYVFDAQKRRELELLVVPERLANAHINETAGAATRVLYTGHPYGALLQGVALYTDWYNVKLSAEMQRLTAPEQVSGLLATWGATHVVHTVDGRKPGQQIVGAHLAAHYRPVAEFGRIHVYDLRPPNGVPR